MKKIEMVDLKSQYVELKEEIDARILKVCENANFIKGAEVKEFSENLRKYINSNYVIPCANGTDAIQIALMALGLKEGDEVIVPTWTYVATAEVIALLKLKPVFIDAHEDVFNLDENLLESVKTPNTKAIVPVHLYGQCCQMEVILDFAKKHNLFVVEDTAQAIGAVYTFSNGDKKYAGTMGHIGTTSFFPSKNLGCYGDGGAMFTQDETLAKKLEAICDHGQVVTKYYHDIIGVNSRLDTMQATILDAKLKHLNRYEASRNEVANYYDAAFAEVKEIETPKRVPNSTHVFHQYTLKVKNGKREELKQFLASNDIPSMIYYPLPLHFQKAYSNYLTEGAVFTVSEQMAVEVLSLPIHTEMEEDQLQYITTKVKEFFNGSH